VDPQTFRPPPGAPFSVSARWILPVSSPPLAGGAVEIDASGRVLAVHRQPPVGTHDLGAVALVPGLVNAHTHLEFSELAEPLQPAQPFAAWLRALVAYRRQRGDAQRAIRAGLSQSRTCGTIAVGDIDTRGKPDQYSAADPGQDLAQRPAHVVAFRELLGLDPATVALQTGTAAEFLDHPSTMSSQGVVRGLSPHAPYTVHPRLLDSAISLALNARAPLTMHLAETRAELECLAAGTGDLVEMLTAAGIWQGPLYPPGTRPLDFLRRLAPLPRVAIAHGNYLAEDELDFLAVRPNFTLVYCPRTHAFFGHRDHPWQKLAERGAVVAIGTDGRCSNPDLSVWGELQFLRRNFPPADAAQLLRMGTLHGAIALGLADRLGTIEPGKSPGLAVIRLGQVGETDPYDELFHENSHVVNLITG
jgi:cytosine/adenosine deaminase-related metal-dependent hydrolase